IDDMSITIVEGADRVLRTMSEDSSTHAAKYLSTLLVDVKLGQNVKSYVDGTVELTDGSKMNAGMVIWTAGVKAVGFDVKGGSLPITRGGRIEVDGFNKVVGLDDIYALGDICFMTADKAFPQGHPQLAQVAIQQGANLAKNLNRKPSKQPKQFVYNDKGSMATVGRNRAVVELKHMQINGFMAWLTWMFVHLMSLLGMRNKVVVLCNWLWAYFTYGTSLRLLIHPSKYPLRKRWEEI
ncbi:MAG: FAD-dependent oxidoreductase, partial [Muribaculaceae bacterium]|nr:FAD-dependent oxidoreductase [Muribaculaceae bacterium]